VLEVARPCPGGDRTRRRAGFARLAGWQPVGNWLVSAANSCYPQALPRQRAEESRRTVCVEKWSEAQGGQVASVHVSAPRKGQKPSPAAEFFSISRPGACLRSSRVHAVAAQKRQSTDSRPKRLRRERPCGRAAERSQEFPSSDVACHVRWGSFMQWRDDTTFPKRGLRLRLIGKSMPPNDCLGSWSP
jgi:hypothetical protein